MEDYTSCFLHIAPSGRSGQAQRDAGGLLPVIGGKPGSREGEEAALDFFPTFVYAIRNERRPPHGCGPVSAPCSNEICACDGIGRHARFRFSCSDACGFESLQAHQKERHDLWSCLSFWVPAAGGGLHPPGFQCSGRQSRPCAKVFTCGENACAAHSRRGPEGPFGGSSAIVSSIQNIDFTPRFQNKRTSGGMSFCFWFRCQKGGSVLRHLNAQNGRAGPPPVRWDAASGERLCGTEYGSPGKDPHPFWASICSFSSLRYTHRSVFSSRAVSSSACRAWSSWSFT